MLEAAKEVSRYLMGHYNWRVLINTMAVYRQQ